MSSKKSTKRDQAQTSKSSAAVERVKSLKPSDALTSVSNTSLTVQGLFGQIQQAIVTQLSERDALEEAIRVKKGELAALHAQDDLLLTMDELRISHEALRKRLEEDFDTQRKELHQQEEEYSYELTLSRKREADAHLEKLRQEDRDRKLHLEDLEKKWHDREIALAAKESEYRAAIEKLNSFDDAVKAIVNKEVAIVTNVLKKDHSHETQLLNIQHKAELDNLRANNTRLNEQLDVQITNIASLAQQLREAQLAQTQLAKDAVASAAGQKALADMQSLLTNTGGPNGSRSKT